MIVFGRIKNNVPSRGRHYLSMSMAWLYVLGWIAAIYFVWKWDISTAAKYTLDFILLALAPWPLTPLYQSYGSFLKEYERRDALSALDPPLMLEDYEDIEQTGGRGEIVFLASREDILNDPHDILSYHRYLGYDAQGRKFSTEHGQQELISVDISDKLDALEAKRKAIDWITYMMGGSKIQEVAQKKNVKADRDYLECLSLKGIYESGLKLGL
ncbi:MAG: hypothetical protein JSV52_08120 [Candidatus Zixiibacteriota bacterium]|nr:MAG: hypothetical protein JSV52_08120 [candidate division Zixibacteria bacterium]